jgi:hypothetical protein
MRKPIFLLIGILFGCSSHENSAGKGVITETTNIGVARGHVEISQGEPASKVFIQIFRADQTPSAWEGMIYGEDTTDENGNWSIDDLYEGDYQVIAFTKDSLKMGQGYFTIKAEQDSLATLDIPLADADTLFQVFPYFQEALDTMPEGYQLRACLRGLGRWTFMGNDGSFEFDGVPRGKHYVRVQYIDGVPGHETTIWEDWVDVTEKILGSTAKSSFSYRL